MLHEGIAVVRAGRRQTVRPLVLTLIGLAVVGVLVATHGPLSLVIGLPLFCVGVVGALGLGVILVQAPAMLTLDAKGVYLGSWRPWFIPWDEIASVRVRRSRSKGAVGLVPTDRHLQHWTRPRVARWNTRISGVPASISGQLLPIGLEEIVALMRTFRPGLVAEDGEARRTG